LLDQILWFWVRKHKGFQGIKEFLLSAKNSNDWRNQLRTQSFKNQAGILSEDASAWVPSWEEETSTAALFLEILRKQFLWEWAKFLRNF